MRAVIRHCAKPKSRNAGYDAEDIHIFIDLPFVPAAGTLLKVTPEGDYLKVNDVMWSVTEPDLLDVGTEDPDILLPLKNMLAQGWIVGDYGVKP